VRVFIGDEDDSAEVAILFLRSWTGRGRWLRLKFTKFIEMVNQVSTLTEFYVT
jgi:hypothetical protein